MMLQQEIPDEALIDAWRAGDSSAGQALVQRYYPEVRRFFVNKIIEPANRDDLVQQTFAGLLAGGLANFRGASSFRTYLLKIAHRRLYDHLRRRYRLDGRVEPFAASIAVLTGTPSQAVAAGEAQARLRAALRELPLDQQTVLELHYWHELGVEVIAEVVGAPVGTVKDRLRRGREMLSRRLGGPAGVRA